MPDTMSSDQDTPYIDKEGNRVVKGNIQRKKRTETADYSILAHYSSVGFSIIVPVIIGTFLGVYLDQRFGTKPVLTIVLIFFGTVLGFYNLFKEST